MTTAMWSVEEKFRIPSGVVGEVTYVRRKDLERRSMSCIFEKQDGFTSIQRRCLPWLENGDFRAQFWNCAAKSTLIMPSNVSQQSLRKWV